MGALAELLKGAQPVLWLDSHAYAGRLLAGGQAPWLDVAQFVAWQRKTLGLLKSDIAPLPVAEVVDAWLAANPPLREAMAAKSRATFPLKTLLADPGLRAHLLELVRGLRAASGGVIALVLPSPRAWVARAYRQAHGSAIEVGADEADSASVLVADFLRAFGEAGVDALLLAEDAEHEPASAEELRWYQPVFNVAANYRWDAGVRLPSAAHAVAELAFIIAPRVVEGTATGLAMNGTFWSAAQLPACPSGGFRYAEIPADAQPESVLERLATLR